MNQVGEFRFQEWFQRAWRELTTYLSEMNQTHWAVLATCAVAFGFLCLRGTNIRG